MKKFTYSAEHNAFLRRNRLNKILINFIRVGILIVLLAAWELCAQAKIIDPFITSSPSRIASTIKDLYLNGSLFYHIGITLMETVIGFFIAVIVGYLVAVLLWSSTTAQKMFEPYIVVLNALPKIALGPLIIIWIGTGYTAIIFMTVIVAIIVCIMNTLTSFLSVDKTMLTLMQAMGASKLTTLKKLVIPATMPQLMNTLKVAVGLAWIGSIMGEYIVSRAGLGYLIIYGGQVFKLDLVMTSIIILCTLTALMYGLIAIIEKLIDK